MSREKKNTQAAPVETKTTESVEKTDIKSVNTDNSKSGKMTSKKAVKKSASKKQFLLYLTLLIVVGIIGIIIASIKYFRVNKQFRSASTSIEFSYDGAAQNLTPSGEKFSIASLTGEKVITAALQRLGLYGKYFVEDIQKCSVVNGSYPEDIIDEIKRYDSLFDFTASREVLLKDYYPTVYTLTLYDDFDPSISEKDLSGICNAIVNEFKSFFMKEYVNSFDMEDFDSLLVIDKYDYSQRVKILSYKAQLLQNYASILYEERTDFRYNEMTFNDLFTKCDDLRNNSLAKADALVTMNALSVSSARLKNQYEYEIQQLQNELKNQKSTLEQLDVLIEGYETDDILYIGAGDSVTKIDSNSTETYEELMDKRLEITDRITEINSDLERFNLYLEDLKNASTSSSLKQDVETKLSAVSEQLIGLENTFKEMVTAYNNTLVSDDFIEIYETEYSAPKVLSGSFIKEIVKCAGPLCVVMLILCLLHGFICSVKKYKKSLI